VDVKWTSGTASDMLGFNLGRHSSDGSITEPTNKRHKRVSLTQQTPRTSDNTEDSDLDIDFMDSSFDSNPDDATGTHYQAPEVQTSTVEVEYERHLSGLGQTCPNVAVVYRTE
jgi:hypothetical protein